MKKYLSIFILLINNVFTSNVYADNHMENYQNKIKAANQGDVSAQYNLGLMYFNGHGVVQSYQEAVKWYRKAANQNYASAQLNLGVMYDNGRGVVQSYQEAVKWYRKAANQNYASAQYNLGVMYSNGYGVIKNYTLSYMWLILAKYHNDNYADNAINNIKNRMTSVQVNKSQKMARICFESGYTKCN